MTRKPDMESLGGAPMRGWGASTGWPGRTASAAGRPRRSRFRLRR